MAGSRPGVRVRRMRRARASLAARERLSGGHLRRSARARPAAAGAAVTDGADCSARSPGRSHAASRAGLGRLRVRRQRGSQAVRGARRRQPPAGLGGEDLHLRRGPHAPGSDRPSGHHGSRRRLPDPRGHMARQPVPPGRRRPDAGLPRLRGGLRPGPRLDGHLPGRPAGRARRHTRGDRKRIGGRVAVRRVPRRSFDRLPARRAGPRRPAQRADLQPRCVQRRRDGQRRGRSSAPRQAASALTDGRPRAVRRPRARPRPARRGRSRARRP